MAVRRFVVEQPAQQIQAALQQCRVVERDSRGDHRLGEHRVRVGQSRLGPRPGAVAVGCGERSRIVGDELACRLVLGVDGEKFGGAQARRKPSPAADVDRAWAARSNWITANLADHAHVTVGGGGTEPPDAPAPVVLRGRLVRPTAVAVHSVAAGTVEGLRLVQEPHGKPGETVHLAVGVGFSGGDDEHPGHVVGAVAVLAAGVRRSRRARTCRDGPSVAADGRSWQAVSRSVIPAPAARRGAGPPDPGTRSPRPATPSPAPIGGPPRPWSRRDAAASAPGAGQTPWRPGSSWPTTMPAPVPRSSTACGNAVATTGRPHAMASTRTPEVT